MADPLSPSGMRGCEALGVFSSLSPGSRLSVVTSAVQMAVRAGVTVPLSLPLTAAAALARPDVTEGRRKEGGRKRGRKGGTERWRPIQSSIGIGFRYRRNSQNFLQNLPTP